MTGTLRVFSSILGRDGLPGVPRPCAGFFLRGSDGRVARMVDCLTMSLAEELAELDRERNPHRRGRRFEAFLANLLEEEGYQVISNPKVAQPRQSDLIAEREGTFFLVASSLSAAAVFSISAQNPSTS